MAAQRKPVMLVQCGLNPRGPFYIITASNQVRW